MGGGVAEPSTGSREGCTRTGGRRRPGCEAERRVRDSEPNHANDRDTLSEVLSEDYVVDRHIATVLCWLGPVQMRDVAPIAATFLHRQWRAWSTADDGIGDTPQCYGHPAF